MPDITAGSTVKAQDFPPSQTSLDTTIQDDVSSTSYIAGSPELGVTFEGPTSGKVVVIVSAGARTAADQVVLVSFQIFEDNSSGTEIVAPSADQAFRVYSSNAGKYASGSYTTMVTGLTAGQTYYARTMHRVDGGSTNNDIRHREISVYPVS